MSASLANVADARRARPAMQRVVTGLASIRAASASMCERTLGHTAGGHLGRASRATVSDRGTGAIARAAGGLRVADAVQAPASPIAAARCVVLAGIGGTRAALTDAAEAAGCAFRLPGAEGRWRRRGRSRMLGVVSSRSPDAGGPLLLVLDPPAGRQRVVGARRPTEKSGQGAAQQTTQDGTAATKCTGQGIEAIALHKVLPIRRRFVPSV